MGTDPEIANEELEALLAGHGRDKNLDLTRFVDDLSTAFPATTPAAAAHLAAIADQAHLLADKGDPVVRPASNAVAPVPQASRPPKRRRNTMKDKKARILLKVGAPVVAVFAVLGIMGSAGALPRALQHMTSHAAGFVGLNLPTGEDTEGDGTDTTDQGDQNDQGDTTSTDTSDQGDQNDQGTGSSDSSDQGDQNDQGGSTGTSGGGSDQGDQNDQGGSTGTSGGGSSENDQGDGGSSQDNQGDSSGDGGSSSSTSSGDGNSQN
jgi:hypothetical protein